MDPEGMSDGDEATPGREVRYVVHLMLLVSLYLAYLTLRSFLHPIVFAAVLASLCAPPPVQHRRVSSAGATGADLPP